MGLPKPVIAALSGLMGVFFGFGIAMLGDSSSSLLGQLSTSRSELSLLKKQVESLHSELLKTKKSANSFKRELDIVEAGDEGNQGHGRENLLESRLQSAREENARLSKVISQRKSQRTITVGSKQVILRPTVDRFLGMERFYQSGPNWSKLSTHDKNKSRTYGHTSGVRSKFWTDKHGIERMQFTYRKKDKSQDDMSTVLWLSLCMIGGGNKGEETVCDANTERITSWLESPTEILILFGGMVQASVLPDGTAVINIFGLL